MKVRSGINIEPTAYWMDAVTLMLPPHVNIVAAAMVFNRAMMGYI